MNKYNSSLNKLGKVQTWTSCLLLFSCGLLFKNNFEEIPLKLIQKHRYENAREWAPQFLASDDSLSGIFIDFIFDNAEDSSFIPQSGSSDLFALWRYPLNISRKSLKRKEPPSFPNIQKPRNVTYEYYEMRGESMKPRQTSAKGKYSFNAPTGRYLVLFELIGFQQDLIKNFEVRRGQYSRLKVYVRSEPINIY